MTTRQVVAESVGTGKQASKPVGLVQGNNKMYNKTRNYLVFFHSIRPMKGQEKERNNNWLTGSLVGLLVVVVRSMAYHFYLSFSLLLGDRMNKWMDVWVVVGIGKRASERVGAWCLGTKASNKKNALINTNKASERVEWPAGRPAGESTVTRLNRKQTI